MYDLADKIVRFVYNIKERSLSVFLIDDYLFLWKGMMICLLLQRQKRIFII